MQVCKVKQGQIDLASLLIGSDGAIRWPALMALLSFEVNKAIKNTKVNLLLSQQFAN